MAKIRIEEVFKALPTIEDLDRPQAMIEQWGTSQHLARTCKMTIPNVTINLAKLKTEGRAHVHAWVNECRAPQWVRGPGENALRPTSDEDEIRERKRLRAALQREQERADKPPKEVGAARASTHDTIERARQKPRDPFAALFDPAPVQS
jgi:hypothetical protein